MFCVHLCAVGLCEPDCVSVWAGTDTGDNSRSCVTLRSKSKELYLLKLASIPVEATKLEAYCPPPSSITAGPVRMGCQPRCDVTYICIVVVGRRDRVRNIIIDITFV